MTRGRRKDLTIPPSRALLQQRDYRARKAQYVSDLEDRVRRTEEENDRLKKEVETLRLRLAAGGTLGPSPEVVSASSELMHQLTTAAASLAKFQQIAFNEQAQAQAHAHAHALAQAQMQTQNLQPPPPPPSDLDLPPIRAPPPPSHDQRAVGGAFSTLPPPPSPPRQTLHPSRHQPPPEFRHHSLSPSAAPREYMRDPGPPPPPLRAPPGPGHGASPGPASVSAGVGTPSSSSAHRSRGYAEYNAVESAWGYFDSRDLADEDDEEDELYEDEHRRRPEREREREGGHAGGGGMPGETTSGASSSYLTHRMSTLRSTSSTPPADDGPMRMQEDIPMRTR